MPDVFCQHVHQADLNGDSVFDAADYQGEAGSELFELLDNEQVDGLEQLHSKYQEMKASIRSNRPANNS